MHNELRILKTAVPLGDVRPKTWSECRWVNRSVSIASAVTPAATKLSKSFPAVAPNLGPHPVSISVSLSPVRTR